MAFLISLLIFTQSSSGLEFLRIGVGSRAMALGNAYTALADEPFGIYYNPSGICNIRTPYFSSFYGRWFLETDIGSIGGSVPIGKVGTLGFGLRGLYTYKIEYRTEEDSMNYSYYNAYFLNSSMDYARLINNFGIGLGINGIHTKIASTKGNSIFLNTGVKYYTRFGDFGVALLNIGPKVLHTNLPINVRAGICVRPLKNLSLVVDLIKPLKDNISYYWGIEISPIDIFNFRLGYNNDVYEKNFVKKMSGGIGLKIGNIYVDYTATHCGVFGVVHLFTLSYNIIPKPAEEIFAKEKLMSETYLRQGIGYYNQGKYEEALNAWDLAIIWQPDNQEVLDWISKTQADLKAKSVEVFLTEAKNRFTQGNYLEAIYNFQRALELDSTLSEVKTMKLEAERRLKEGVATDIKLKIEDGLTKFKAGDYFKAVQIWNGILKLEPNNTTVEHYIDEANKKIIEEINKTLKEVNDFISQGNLKRAQDLVNRMLRRYPNQENLTKQKLFIDQKIIEKVNEYLAEGKRLFNAQQYTDAEKQFQKVLEYAPKNNQAFIYLEKIGKQTAIGKKEDADRYYLLGIDAYTKNNFELAIDYWNKVLEIAPGYPNVLKNLERARIKLAELNK